jgi:hypothetical protein
MTCYFRKPDIIAIELSFLPKIVKYRLHNLDGSSAGVALRDIKVTVKPTLKNPIP